MLRADQRHTSIVRRLYDNEREVIAHDIVWHVPGQNPVSGDYRGQHAYFIDLPSRMAPLDAWTFSVHDIMVNGDRVVVTFDVHGERLGRSIDTHGCHVVRINDEGKIAEGWGFAADQDALDAFFSP